MEYKDVLSQTHYLKAAASPIPDERIRDCKEDLQKRARDDCRVLVQRDSESNAGFCEGRAKPWMLVNEDDAKVCNTKNQISQGSSVERY